LVIEFAILRSVIIYRYIFRVVRSNSSRIIDRQKRNLRFTKTTTLKFYSLGLAEHRLARILYFYTARNVGNVTHTHARTHARTLCPVALAVSGAHDEIYASCPRSERHTRERCRASSCVRLTPVCTRVRPCVLITKHARASPIKPILDDPSFATEFHFDFIRDHTQNIGIEYADVRYINLSTWHSYFFRIEFDNFAVDANNLNSLTSVFSIFATQYCYRKLLSCKSTLKRFHRC